MHGVILTSFLQKKYDLLFLLIYKLFSFFSCHYILIIDDLIYQSNNFVINIELLKISINILLDYIFTIDQEGFIFHILSFLSFYTLYITVSIIPFILMRIVKKYLLE
jgi:hypothetical protein